MEFNIQLDHAHVVPVSVLCKFHSSLPTKPIRDDEELTVSAASLIYVRLMSHLFPYTKNSFKQGSEELTMKLNLVRACRILLIAVAILLCQFYSSEAHRGLLVHELRAPYRSPPPPPIRRPPIIPYYSYTRRSVNEERAPYKSPPPPPLPAQTSRP
ncbi:unnamed protein product [Musa acuminata subsp. burmannicoides]